MGSLRPTAHDHGHDYPICSHFEYAELGYAPMTPAMLDRSRDLSALAGYPGAVTDASMDDVIATYGRPYEAPEEPDPSPVPSLNLYLQWGLELVVAQGDFTHGIELHLLPSSGASVTFAGTSLAFTPTGDIVGTLTGDLGGTDAVDTTVTFEGVYDEAGSDATAIVFRAAES